MTQARVTAIYRYPVKGFSPQKLDAVQLAPGQAIAFDRAYAIENGGHEFDALNPVFMPKTKFLMLQRDERLATIGSDFDEATGVLTLSRDGRQIARGDLTTPTGRQIIEQFLAAYMAKELRGAPRIVHAPGHTVSDCGAAVVSLINLATVRDLERVTGRAVDPLRFRANLYVDGIAPWAEFDWIERQVTSPSGVRLRAVQRIQRCAATHVNPATGARDMNIVRTLADAFDHPDCGVYLRVESAGRLEPGLALEAE